MKKTLILIFVTFIFNSIYSQTNDTISSIIEDVKNSVHDEIQNIEKLNVALKYTYNIPNDSLRNIYFLRLAFYYKKNSDSLKFRETINQSILLSEQLKDSNSLARCYWRLGDFFNNKKNDSAYHYYYNAQDIYKLTSEKFKMGRMLFNMALVQKKVKDYIGSEVSTFNAIEVFKPLNDYKRLYSCYNNLGIIFKNLEEYKKSLEYHSVALDYLKKIKENEILKTYTLNNIGLVYRYQGKYNDAINNFKQALKIDSLYYKDTKQYAILLDNLAYTKFLSNETSELPDLFNESLKIRDSLKIKSGIAVSKLHLAEYYLEKNDTVQSLRYVSEARVSAIESKNLKQVLNSLLLSSKIDHQNGTHYLDTYIHINDSLIKRERQIRDKFARIRFETDQYIIKNEKLSLQNDWIVAISTAIIFFGFLIYVITQQRTRNKELEMEQQQQLANEEIYNLMIDQQDKIEEGRKREKERISLELHDGILGRLFGTRLSLGSLNAKDDTNSKKIREQYINELQSIEEEVRNISHELGLDNFDKTTSYSTMITNLLEEQSKITNFKYQIEDDDRIVWTDIPGHIKINIYRIIQESIQNINKYAQAENVVLDFKKNEDHIILTIKDDGVGFDQDKRSSGIGLKNMKSRVTLLHGQFTINSIPGKGTSISVDVPMT
ncbi:tetratricopeptide repeat-containing sensor histidine kinase [Kordia sp.]|uniref:tetratricopeptide repeat-containing sensor histidine kinase n=1 Tax=Kordia sp. TaxID=1965332 RepID=UPI003B59D6FC